MSLIGAVTPLVSLPESSGRLGAGGRRLLRSGAAAGMGQPKLSVITVTLNSDLQLEKTMQSVLQWPDDQVEYIVIDGGSTDNTLAVLEEYDSRLEYWVSEPDEGISDAFNKGLCLSRGEIIGILNAGDWYGQQTLHSVLTAFAAHPGAGVLCGRLQFWQGGKKAYCTDAVPRLLPRGMSVAHPACFVTRATYLRHGGFHLRYRLAMDYELLLRFFVNGVAFVRADSVLANMLHDGLSEKNWRQALQETHRARRQYMGGSIYATGSYLWYLVCRRFSRHLLQALGLHGLVRFYRERIAAVKKVRME